MNDNLFEELKNYDGEDRVVSSFDIKKILESHRDQKNVKSNFATLDKHLEGFEAGELIAVSGPRKSGKTLFCQSLTYQFNNQNVSPLWFNFENTPRNFYRVFEGVGLPFFTQPMILKANALDWIETRIVESLVKFGTGIVFIDHLHYVLDLEQKKNMSIEIGTIIRRLKFMCIEYNLIIFLLCHMKKGSLNGEPTDADIRDSSFIAQESDAGLLIYRTTIDKPNTSWLKICYSRRTGVFEKKIQLIKANGLLREVSLHDEETENRNFSEEVQDHVYRGD